MIRPPAGVNLMAFLIRFQRACWNRMGSASMWCLRAIEVDHELKLSLAEIVAADIDDVVDELMGVDRSRVRRGATRGGCARGRGGRR